ncbi:MAG: SDR family oxidoreductase, partial [Sphingomonadaceae bacterium]|nr:SDR family oxidoreductase [Sphingomonadaceae bacterium]
VTPAQRPVLIAGATGTLGQALAGGCRLRGLAHVLTDRATLALDDPRSIARALDRHKPWAVINAAGWVRVDDAEGEEAACHAANATGAAALAAACAERGIHHTLFSSDLVFDGTAGRPYVETDAPAPLNAYGRSKAAAEAMVLGQGRSLIIRTAAFFSPYDEHNFAVHLERALRAGRPFAAADSFVVTPTFVPHLVAATLDLVVDDATGLWHLTNGEALSWFDFGRRVAEALGLPFDLVRPASPRDLGWRAARPRDVALGSIQGRMLPPFAEALAHFAERRAAFAAAAQAA